jgi:hypothetical protein
MVIGLAIAHSQRAVQREVMLGMRSCRREGASLFARNGCKHEGFAGGEASCFGKTSKYEGV